MNYLHHCTCDLCRHYGYDQPEPRFTEPDGEESIPSEFDAQQASDAWERGQEQLAERRS